MFFNNEKKEKEARLNLYEQFDQTSEDSSAILVNQQKGLQAFEEKLQRKKALLLQQKQKMASQPDSENENPNLRVQEEPEQVQQEDSTI